MLCKFNFFGHKIEPVLGLGLGLGLGVDGQVIGLECQTLGLDLEGQVLVNITCWSMGTFRSVFSRMLVLSHSVADVLSSCLPVV